MTIMHLGYSRSQQVPEKKTVKLKQKQTQILEKYDLMSRCGSQSMKLEIRPTACMTKITMDYNIMCHVYSFTVYLCTSSK